MKRFLIYITLILCLLFSGCDYDKFDRYNPDKDSPVHPNMDIGDIRALYVDKPLNVRDDIIIAGYVSANDRSGNFYRTFIIEDHTGAIEVRAGIYNLFNTYSAGRYVAVKMQGLTIGSYNAVLQLGLAPTEPGSSQPGYFGYRAVIDGYVYKADVVMEVNPIAIKISDAVEDMCGRLVMFENMVFVPDEKNQEEESTWAIAKEGDLKPETGFRIFEDIEGEKIAVVTSGYADFARNIVPKGELSLTGILMKGKTNTGKTMFMLKMRDINDVHEY